MIWGRADVIIVEIKITTNITCLNYPKPSPSPALWKIFLPQNQSPVPQRLGTSALYNIWCCLFHIESVITSLTRYPVSSVHLLSRVQLFESPWTTRYPRNEINKLPCSPITVAAVRGKWCCPGLLRVLEAGILIYFCGRLYWYQFSEGQLGKHVSKALGMFRTILWLSLYTFRNLSCIWATM